VGLAEPPLLHLAIGGPAPM